MPVINSKRAVIFYKNAKDNSSIRKSIWQAQKTTKGIFTPQKDGAYQFMIVLDYSNPLAMVTDFNIQPIPTTSTTDIDLGL